MLANCLEAKGVESSNSRPLGLCAWKLFNSFSPRPGAPCTGQQHCDGSSLCVPHGQATGSRASCPPPRRSAWWLSSGRCEASSAEHGSEQRPQWICDGVWPRRQFLARNNSSRAKNGAGYEPRSIGPTGGEVKQRRSFKRRPRFDLCGYMALLCAQSRTAANPSFQSSHSPTRAWLVSTYCSRPQCCCFRW